MKKVALVLLVLVPSLACADAMDDARTALVLASLSKPKPVTPAISKDCDCTTCKCPVCDCGATKVKPVEAPVTTAAPTYEASVCVNGVCSNGACASGNCNATPAPRRFFRRGR